MFKNRTSQRWDIITVVCLIIFSTACTEKAPFDPDKYLSEKKIQSLEDQVNSLAESLEENRKALFMLDNSSATFTSDGDGFQRVDSSIGSFLVALKEIKSYADGYKITVHLGNPNFATYHNCILKVRWGKRRPRNPKYKEYKEWEESLHEKITNLSSALSPGSWNPTNIVLAPASKEDIGNIEISLSTPSVSLKAK